MARGWTRREAGWLALVCLHSGVFFRSRYLAFIGRTNPALANRFIRRCRKVAVEQPWNGSRLRLCRIAARRLYRAVGVAHLRYRRAAAPEVVLQFRRLLSLDYLLEHPRASRFPTEEEKVSALTAAGIPKQVLPRRFYAGAVVRRADRRDRHGRAAAETDAAGPTKADPEVRQEIKKLERAASGTFSARVEGMTWRPSGYRFSVISRTTPPRRRTDAAQLTAM